jgi:transcriptional antiterminator NusG
MKWYVIRVVSGKEKKMKETIENKLKENNMLHIISNLLVPSHKDIQLRRGKKVNVEKNFFPGYIFVECESINEVEANIKHINGITSILKQPLAQTEIDRILGRENKKDVEENLYLNQTVKIIDGPFSSFVGTIKELEKNKQKAKVGILIFGRETILDLTFDQIVKDVE